VFIAASIELDIKEAIPCMFIVIIQTITSREILFMEADL
jgi:hypothetical protein